MPQPAQQDEKKKSYKTTLNLPKTAFPMKANLVQNEPATLKRWQKQNLYQKIRQARSGGGGSGNSGGSGGGSRRYNFHDGPPYANGSIHLGHLLNKVLKDIVVRSKTMAGYDCPYIPGWDCHGLPIEHKVMQELGDQAKGMTALQIRRKCKTYAEKFVKLQSKQMQRLLTLADYDDPYLTMNPAYEAAVLEVFAGLVEKGLVYRALKPVHWSIANQTALADAELEYYDREDTSIYVLFEIEDTSQLPASLNAPPGEPVCLMIWTTTPWTLPANLAVAVHGSHEYCLIHVGHKHVIVASQLAEKVAHKAGLGDFKLTDQPRVTGSALTGLTYRHPFIDRVGPVVTADYVTLEDGTGLVHTAPGHGVEDYQTAKANHLYLKGKRVKIFSISDLHEEDDILSAPRVEIYCPVKADGAFDDTVPEWLQGVIVWDANKIIMKRLHDSGRLFHQETLTHSYPHDWRSKTPVIFRATEQLFVDVDRRFNDNIGLTTLRHLAMGQTKNDISFFPEWGRNRMRGMLESRPDWCLSRQRAWGLPIPIFFLPGKEDTPLITRNSVRAVAANIAKHGSDYWFSASPQELLAGYDPSLEQDKEERKLGPPWLERNTSKFFQNQAPTLIKSHDIFDVWFESGSSWNAVLRQRGLGFPADLYLEGSDQHRGWFQLSLLPAIGVTGRSPFKAVLTHGFMVDKDGRKMSKSGGNALEVDTLLKDFGADVCRWWVGSLNADNDIKVDHEFFRVAGEEYRKVRNTLRFLLSNLNGFDPRPEADGGHRYGFTDADATSLDAWALGQLNGLIQSVRHSYDAFAFRKVHEAIYRFCNETLSAVYLAATKDRLYCDPPTGPRRRRTQTAIHQIADALIRLIAPILPHTADEAWHALHGDQADSVHLSTFPEPVSVAIDPDWERVMAIRDHAMKAIEEARATRGIDNPLDCGLRLLAGGATQQQLAKFDPTDWADLCGISRVEWGQAGANATTTDGVGFDVLDLRQEPRCERCWKRDGTVKARSDGGLLSDRDAHALGLTPNPS